MFVGKFYLITFRYVQKSVILNANHHYLIRMSRSSPFFCLLVYDDGIRGFCQLSSEVVIVTDPKSNCLKLVDRKHGLSYPYAGSCANRLKGLVDGPSMLALFDFPISVLVDQRDKNSLFITDQRNYAIRHIDLPSRFVSTWVKTRDLIFPRGIVQDSSTGDVYVTTSHSVCRVVYHDKSLFCFAGDRKFGYIDGVLGASRFYNMYGIALINKGNAIMVVDGANSLLRLLDLETQLTSSICTTLKEAQPEKAAQSGHIDGDFQNCMLFAPYSLLSSGDSLYIGEYQSIRQIKGETFTNNFNLCDRLYLSISISILRSTLQRPSQTFC